MTSMQAVHQTSETPSAIVVSAFKDLSDALDPLIVRSEQQEHLNLKTLFFFCGNDLAERYRYDRWGFRVKPNDWSRLCQAVIDNRAPSLLPSQAFSPANEASAIAFLATYLQEHAPAPMFSGPIDWNREARLAWAMLEMKVGRTGQSSSSPSLLAESDVVIGRLDELAVADCSSSLKEAFKHFRAEVVW